MLWMKFAKRNLNEWCRDRRVPSNSSINRRGFWARLDFFSFEREFGIALV